MSFIFVSYSRQDQDYVSQLVQALKAQELPVWLDDRIDYGTTWPRVIEEHLENCQVVLLVMSPCSRDSHWVQCELSHALSLGKPIFPLLLEGRRWLSVAALQVVDVTNGGLPPSKFFDAVRQHFPKAPATSQTISITDAAREPIPVPAPLLSPQIKPVSQPAKPVADDLSSEKGINYTRLRDLLKAGEWKEADNETYLRMLEAVGRKKGDWIRSEELLNFPCADLKTIDRLWVKYSDGQFGFSVQKEIYVQCGAKLDGKYPGDKIWEEFCDRTGWRVNGSYIYYSDVTFSTSAPQGHLPFCHLGGGGVSRRVHGFFSRIQTCKV